MTDIKARLADWRTVHPGDEDDGALYIAARDRIVELESKLVTARVVIDYYLNHPAMGGRDTAMTRRAREFLGEPMGMSCYLRKEDRE